MDREQQLQWERQSARWAAGAALVSAALSIASAIYQRGVSPVPQNTAQYLVSLDAQPNRYLIGAILAAISTVLLAPVLYYLYRATKFRRQVVPQLALYLALLAPVAYAGVVVATVANQTSIAHQFVKTPEGKTVKVGAKADKKVDDKKGSVNSKAQDKLTSNGLLAGVSIAATLAIAVAFVLICLNAMRAGLFGRFMGSVGMVIGALYVFQVIQLLGFIVLLFWVPALALLFLDRWPQGRGPAWDAGEAIPWPSAQERRDAVAGVERPARPARPAGGGGLLGNLLRGPAPAADAEPDPEPEPQHTREPVRPREQSTHPRSKKKRKRR